MESPERTYTARWLIDMDAVRKEVENLVQKELESANKKFPMFASRHEGAAVIVEEIQEAEEELQKVKGRFMALWSFTKGNAYSEILSNELKNFAISLVVESIQVAAMAQKFIDSENNRQLARIKKEKGC